MFLKNNKNYVINKGMQNDILFKKLSYSFNDVEVLKDVNLKINSGSKVMVIGSSGGGKSTLFKILKKYYDVSRGQVFIDNYDINDYKNSDIVYVSQNEVLFTDTILNNIGKVSDTSEICLLDDILNRNLGYNTLIEENGFNISGGEKQRIVLARALNKDFNILIIDEGLSQVDINMERKILKNVFSKYKDKTIIFISHRIDNVDLFDQVVKVDKGEVSSESKNK